jgi:hypothetical protein
VREGRVTRSFIGTSGSVSTISSASAGGSLGCTEARCATRAWTAESTSDARTHTCGPAALCDSVVLTHTWQRAGIEYAMLMRRSEGLNAGTFQLL